MGLREDMFGKWILCLEFWLIPSETFFYEDLCGTDIETGQLPLHV